MWSGARHNVLQSVDLKGRFLAFNELQSIAIEGLIMPQVSSVVCKVAVRHFTQPDQCSKLAVFSVSPIFL